jgi:dTDP-4-dehydrorhamnose reductase
MNKLLVVGVDTIAGAGIAQALADRCEVSAISFQSGVAAGDFPTEFVRHQDVDELASAIDRLDPHWIVYAGSLSAANWDLPASDAAWDREPAVARTVTACAQAHGAKLMAISSDAVFAGPKMFHEENEPTDSPHRAARSILECEQILAAGGALVVRSHIYGWAPAGAQAGLVEQIAQALLAGAAPPIDGWRYASPMLAGDLAEFLLRSVDRNLSGLYHLGGAERANPFRLACELAGLMGISMPRNLNAHFARPSDNGWLLETSLDSRRARRAFNMPLPMLREGLKRFADLKACARSRRSDMPERQAA